MHAFDCIPTHSFTPGFTASCILEYNASLKSYCNAQQYCIFSIISELKGFMLTFFPILLATVLGNGSKLTDQKFHLEGAADSNIVTYPCDVEDNKLRLAYTRLSQRHRIT